MSPPSTIAISLVSHTNAGKTTLARTLLQRDVGEVRDAPHVTEFTEDHLLLRSDAGDELRLSDTPGFGDSVRLVRRLRAQGSPIGWFLSEVWDRWRDRAFWASQQALRHVRERADAVLYLVSEDAPNQTILCAGAGTFAVARIVESAGVWLPQDEQTPEGIAAHWGEITSTVGENQPKAGMDQTLKMVGKAMTGLGLNK